MPPPDADPGAGLGELRRATFAIAYRMTGSVAEAEDLVQEAFVRFERARRDGVHVESPQAWLSAVTTRLAIDHMRSARARRERYVGPWLPEPLVAEAAEPSPGPAEHAETADSLSQAFLVLLESLSPVERAVLLLKDVFGYDYPEIAAVVGKRSGNCRQIAARARRAVEARRPRFAADRARADALLDRFLAAADTGDTEALKAMLAADITLYSDGGGKAPAARHPIHGPDRVARLMRAIARKRQTRGGYSTRRVVVNGAPGRLVIDAEGAITDVITVDVADDLIQAVRIIRNPEKLRHVGAASPAARHAAG